MYIIQYTQYKCIILVVERYIDIDAICDIFIRVLYSYVPSEYANIANYLRTVPGTVYSILA